MPREERLLEVLREEPLLEVLRPEALRRVREPLRSEAGISACATDLVSCGIRRSRKLDIRSS